MKKQISFIIVIVAFLLTSAYTSGQDKLTSEFISNFEQMNLPLEVEVTYAWGKSKVVESKFYNILTDTTGGFTKWEDGNVYFNTQYYYLGAIPSNNKNFDIIIVGELQIKGMILQ